MKTFIDQDGCIACGQCYGTCPQVFGEGDSGIAHVITEDVPADQEALVMTAKLNCPTSVIAVSDEG